MNIEHLRRALKSEWLTYYRTNRDWIIKLGVWVNCQGQRRPSSSFILGALSSLEPQLTQLLPLVVDLNCNPDRIVIALGLNFNPEDELAALEELEVSPTRPISQTAISQTPISPTQATVKPEARSTPKLLPSSSAPIAAPSQAAPYLAADPVSNPFIQSSSFDFAQSNSTQSNSGQSNSTRSNSTQPNAIPPEPAQSSQVRSEPAPDAEPAPPKSKPRLGSPTARRTLDTAQLHARELPDRETSARRSRNRKS
jgi:hypothetical protein